MFPVYVCILPGEIKWECLFKVNFERSHLFTDPLPFTLIKTLHRFLILQDIIPNT